VLAVMHSYFDGRRQDKIQARGLMHSMWSSSSAQNRWHHDMTKRDSGIATPPRLRGRTVPQAISGIPQPWTCGSNVVTRVEAANKP